jgi:hypothetical protein
LSAIAFARAIAVLSWPIGTAANLGLGVGSAPQDIDGGHDEAPADLQRTGAIPGAFLGGAVAAGATTRTTIPTATAGGGAPGL